MDEQILTLSAQRDELQGSLEASLRRGAELLTELEALSDIVEAVTLRNAHLTAVHDDLAKRFASTSAMSTLISKLHDAKPEPNPGVREFNRLLADDYLRFADAESSLAAEAKSLMMLQSVAGELEMLARFPDIHRRRIVGIVGGFSAGKSSFINSFIEDADVRLAEGIVPVTVIPSYVIPSDRSVIEACAASGGKIDLDPSFYATLSHDLVRSIGFDLSDLMPLIFVRTQLNPELFEHLCLIDTPGYNAGHGVSEGGARDRHQASNLAHRADELVWMIGIDVNGVIPESDMAFICEIGHGRPIYVVLNKSDQRSKEDIAEIMDAVSLALDLRGIDVAGISAYSAASKRELAFTGLSLHDFLRKANVPGDAGSSLVNRVHDVFDMYDEALDSDRRLAERQRMLVSRLDLATFATGGTEFRNKVAPNIVELKKALSVAPAKALFEQSLQLRQRFVECVEVVTGPVSGVSRPVRTQAAESPIPGFLNIFGRALRGHGDT
jgi:GTP-binding protein EngB required for normal cell division